MGTHPIFESDFDCLTDMSSMVAFIDEHEALDLARACQDSTDFLDQKQSYFQNMPKNWSEPEVDYKVLAKKAEQLERVDLMSDSINYKSLLLEIGTYTQNEINKVEQDMPQFIQNEKKCRQKAKQWLQDDSSKLDESSETIKIHVETTCLPLSMESSSSSGTNRPFQNILNPTQLSQHVLSQSKVPSNPSCSSS